MQRVLIGCIKNLPTSFTSLINILVTVPSKTAFLDTWFSLVKSSSQLLQFDIGFLLFFNLSFGVFEGGLASAMQYLF